MNVSAHPAHKGDGVNRVRNGPRSWGGALSRPRARPATPISDETLSYFSKSEIRSTGWGWGA